MAQRRIIDQRIQYKNLILPTFQALVELGGSATNEEILDKVIDLQGIPSELADLPHKEEDGISELQYELAWARTCLKKSGIIANSSRGVWSIVPAYSNKKSSQIKVADVLKQSRVKDSLVKEEADQFEDLPDSDLPEEIKPWRKQLSDILHRMDPFGFERLTQRLLRECGFSQVEVTKKTGDGGIDGTGKLKINGIFSFSVAFQCKRYKGVVGAPAIRDFRGSLTTDIEKGVFVTTGSFSKDAKDEAVSPGKKQIDLIDGEEFINKIAQYGIGVREVTSYEVDETFFEEI